MTVCVLPTAILAHSCDVRLKHAQTTAEPATAPATIAVQNFRNQWATASAGNTNPSSTAAPTTPAPTTVAASPPDSIRQPDSDTYGHTSLDELLAGSTILRVPSGACGCSRYIGETADCKDISRHFTYKGFTAGGGVPGLICRSRGSEEECGAATAKATVGTCFWTTGSVRLPPSAAMHSAGDGSPRRVHDTHKGQGFLYLTASFSVLVVAFAVMNEVDKHQTIGQPSATPVVEVVSRCVCSAVVRPHCWRARLRACR